MLQLAEDERFHLVKEMKEGNPDLLDEVRLSERFLEYVEGSMKEAGWTNGTG